MDVLQAERQSQVAEWMAGNKTAGQELLTIIERLEVRLGSVLKPITEVQGDPMEQPSLVPLAEDLRSQCETIQRAIAKIQSIMERLEL